MSRNSSAPVHEPIQVSEASDERDIGITDSIRGRLQADKALLKLAQDSIDNAVATVEKESRPAAREAVALATEIKVLPAQAARDDKLQEFQR